MMNIASPKPEEMFDTLQDHYWATVIDVNFFLYRHNATLSKLGLAKRCTSNLSELTLDDIDGNIEGLDEILEI